MRLINASTLKLETFDWDIPPYAILSHTWGADEVSFQDIQSPDASTKIGFAKIKFTCEEALERGLAYAWVDTCCIDKSSSAELSEAINSMFTWYKNAQECYVFLSDVSDWADMRSEDSQFRRSRWFARGWTLQELLAPRALYIFSSTWQLIGFGGMLAKELSLASGIGEQYLTGMASLEQASISRRMSWASQRVTTRIEDQAYSLLGIFNISMPLLYGEGEKAFLRLQEEIIKTSDDQTIFAWGESSKVRTQREDHGVFAKSPANYYDSGDLIPDELSETTEHYFVTNKGLKINLSVVEHYQHYGPFIAVLACRSEQLMGIIVAIPIHYGNSYCVRASPFIHRIHRSSYYAHPARMRNLTLLSSLHLINHTTQSTASLPFLIRKLPPKLYLDTISTNGEWDQDNKIISRPSAGNGPIEICLHDSYYEPHAVILIHSQPLGHGEGKKELLAYPHAIVRIYRSGPSLLPFEDGDSNAVVVKFQPHPTRLSSGREVAVLDILKAYQLSSDSKESQLVGDIQRRLDRVEKMQTENLNVGAEDETGEKYRKFSLRQIIR